MHLRSISLKGFKSFPERTRLEFGPGVSVVVGPNGSGKSNITDAVLWALGEQSPVAVRGQTMKDVIFAGGHGVKGAAAAEVEVVIDNADGSLDSDFSEISIVRRLDRSADGEYRLNGARCRLIDVMEVLSDTGLGREMHSVVSQGKVEEIVLSRPGERRLLIEEAAGLGKHRKRRRRAELKLARTEENLGRALDVERAARSRLRPLKRQAEAAELHERIERQALEARFDLSRDAVRGVRVELAEAESKAAAARAERDEAERLLAAVAQRREAAEASFAAHSRAREELQAEVFAARSAAELIEVRLDAARDQARVAAERRERRRRQLEVLQEEDSRGERSLQAAERVRALEAELAALEAGREERLRAELAELEAERSEGKRRRTGLERAIEERRGELEKAERACATARAERRAAQRTLDDARARAAGAAAELAMVDRSVGTAGTGAGGARPLAAGLNVEPGYELAFAAALGPRLWAGVVDDVSAGQALLDAAGEAGGLALISSRARRSGPGSAPAPRAERLLARVHPEPAVARLVERLLADVWVVDSVAAVSEYFTGVAVTRSGRLLDASTGELVQVAGVGSERPLEERSRREELVAASEEASRTEGDAKAAVDHAGRSVAAADAARDEAEVALRTGVRAAQEAVDAESRAEWLIGRRRQAPDEGPDAVRRAQLIGALQQERHLAEQAEAERRKRVGATKALAAAIERDEATGAAAERVAAALESARGAVAARRDALAAELDAGAAAGEETAAALRACAHEEAELQGRLKRGSDAVTGAEVSAQQIRDAANEAERELGELATRLGLEPEASAQGAQPSVDAEGAELSPEEREALGGRLERLARRREELGPVNPLAKREYDEAVAHVEELEVQRRDLEAALAELQRLIRETDRRIRESFEQTFEAAARNFEEVVQQLFPGGRGRLRLVRPEAARPVIGGEAQAGDDEQDTEPGVEVEVTPAGKATKRLSLLSGGEKALVALAFMFAVFLARPCPFYVLDEVEAALDDVNIDRFLKLLRRYSERAQFIVVTHQKRTMDAADRVYGVSMGGDGVSRIVSRKLGQEPPAAAAA